MSKFQATFAGRVMVGLTAVRKAVKEKQVEDVINAIVERNDNDKQLETALKKIFDAISDVEPVLQARLTGARSVNPNKQAYDKLKQHLQTALTNGSLSTDDLQETFIRTILFDNFTQARFDKHYKQALDYAIDYLDYNKE